MFTKSPIEARLDKEIESALKELEIHEASSEEYGLVVERVAKLQKLKSEPRLKPPSMDTILIVVANIYGILRITRYERENVITSKAQSFIPKPRS